jgi:hypothetical protein
LLLQICWYVQELEPRLFSQCSCPETQGGLRDLINNIAKLIYFITTIETNVLSTYMELIFISTNITICRYTNTVEDTDKYYKMKIRGIMLHDLNLPFAKLMGEIRVLYQLTVGNEAVFPHSRYSNFTYSTISTAFFKKIKKKIQNYIKFPK